MRQANNDALAIIKTWQGGPVVATIDGSIVAHLSVADLTGERLNNCEDVVEMQTFLDTRRNA